MNDSPIEQPTGDDAKKENEAAADDSTQNSAYSRIPTVSPDERIAHGRPVSHMMQAEAQRHNGQVQRKLKKCVVLTH